ncbi:MAG: Flagellar motor protein MotA [Rhodospirillales bacterium]|nr:Flagellar motor protein MotA [Rhodospirillales bacterium]
MLTIVGSLIVIVCVLGGYAALGGNIFVLWQPFEVVIIVGAAVGAYMIANPKHVLKDTIGGVKSLLGRSKYDRDAYLELLSLLFAVFKAVRTKGWLALEQHIEHPEDSELFRQFPTFISNPHAMQFLCDYLRIISLGSSNPHELDALMDEEIETIHAERLHVATAMQTAADGMPALGIVAAVLGVIKTMGAITEPPEVLGHSIGGALVGTFMGVWLSYGFVGPMAAALKTRIDDEIKYYLCMKTGLLAYLQGSAPQIAIEFARKILLNEVRPTFNEVEDATSAVPTI